MKNVLMIAIFAFGSFQLWEKYKPNTALTPSFGEPYVAVYGRNSCGYTKQMISKLERSGVNYHYYIVDDSNIADSLHAKMTSSGLSTRRYNLPVVDVNGYMQVRPDFAKVLARYNEPL